MYSLVQIQSPPPVASAINAALGAVQPNDAERYQGCVSIHMPSKAPKPCSKLGCNQLTSGRYCQAHTKAEQQRIDNHRGTAHQRGYTVAWRRARAAFLSKHPLCVECDREGKTTPATVVDHIAPHKGDYNLFWDDDNWQSLCATHHNIKTAKEDGGFGKNH